MKKIIIIILSMLTVTIDAQNIENHPLIEIKDSIEIKLNSEALRDLQRSFGLVSPTIATSKAGLKFNPQDYPKAEVGKTFQCPTSLLSNIWMGLPQYEQIRTRHFLFETQTNYGGSPYLLQKQVSLNFPLNEQIAFYIKGNFDWIRQRPVYLSGFIQPISVKTGLSFRFKGGQVLELGIKCQYTVGEKHLDVCQKWNTTADCTLHF